VDGWLLYREQAYRLVANPIYHGIASKGGEMTVQELIDTLKACNPTDVVHIYDPESQDWEAVSGLVHDGGNNVVQLYSDED
jgi:hypothetical protein